MLMEFPVSVASVSALIVQVGLPDLAVLETSSTVAMTDQPFTESVMGYSMYKVDFIYLTVPNIYLQVNILNRYIIPFYILI